MTVLYMASGNGNGKPSLIFSDPKLAYQYAKMMGMTVTRKEVPTPEVKV